jgi:hypothetical protein
MDQSKNVVQPVKEETHAFAASDKKKLIVHD